jgi:hypothetical protein
VSIEAVRTGSGHAPPGVGKALAERVGQAVIVDNVTGRREQHRRRQGGVLAPPALEAVSAKTVPAVPSISMSSN